MKLFTLGSIHIHMYTEMYMYTCFMYVYICYIYICIDICMHMCVYIHAHMFTIIIKSSL